MARRPSRFSRTEPSARPEKAAAEQVATEPQPTRVPVPGAEPTQRSTPQPEVTRTPLPEPEVDTRIGETPSVETVEANAHDWDFDPTAGALAEPSGQPLGDDRSDGSANVILEGAASAVDASQRPVDAGMDLADAGGRFVEAAADPEGAGGDLMSGPISVAMTPTPAGEIPIPYPNINDEVEVSEDASQAVFDAAGIEELDFGAGGASGFEADAMLNFGGGDPGQQTGHDGSGSSGQSGPDHGVDFGDDVNVESFIEAVDDELGHIDENLDDSREFLEEIADNLEDFKDDVEDAAEDTADDVEDALEDAWPFS